MTIFMEGNEQPEFLIFYMHYLPPSNFKARWLDIPNINRVWKYGRRSQIYSVFQNAVSSYYIHFGFNAPDFFGGKTFRLVLPQNGYSMLYNRIEEAHALFDMFQTDERTKTLWKQGLGKLWRHITNHTIVEDKDLIYEHEERVLDWTDPAWTPVDLQPGQVVFTVSDESGHIFVNEERNTLYVVDVGCPALAMGVDRLITNS